ncbi:CtsR family transcriptional regulator [Enterococcus cecorum]|uniref:CtsR family transcriptional regulator n=1 Tax=Enterococcus cecorum TaxID=44008 RepID=UPI0032C3E26C
MSNQNTSDLIEAYLKKFLEEQAAIEIRRAEMAHLFDCVPSQINYVINTRFTIQQGYNVISKRGGGGYIRIEKVQISNHQAFLASLDQLFEDYLSENDAKAMIQKLYEEDLLTQREGNLLSSLFSKQGINRPDDQRIRAQLMHVLLQRLSYEN